MIQNLRLTAVFAVLTGLAACAGRSQSASGAPAASSSEPAAEAPAPAVPAASDSSDPSASSLPQWLTVDSTAKAVTLDLEVTRPPGAPSALINGYRAGEVQVTVPLGWTVKWNWRSADSTSPHSLVVMNQREKIPLEGGRAAFSNAMTRMVTEGLRPGQADKTTFVADEAGWYWLLCGVPSHALDGEWIDLRVDPDATLPDVKVKNRKQ